MKDKTASVTPPGTGTSRRKDKHVSRACNGCRRRKSKCDGVQPVCGTCAMQNHECTWTSEEDGRRPATKAQVDAMSMEIRALKDERDRQDAMVTHLQNEILRLGGGPPHAGSSHIPSPPRSPSELGHPTTLSITIPLNTPLSNTSGPGTALPLQSQRHLRAVSDGAIGMATSSGVLLGIPSPTSHSPVSSFAHSPASQTMSLSPFAHAPPSTPFAHSPASVSSSLPSPLLGTGGGSQFLTVPGQTGLWRALSPEPSLYAGYASSSNDDEELRSAVSDGEMDGPGEHRLMSTFVSTGKRLLIYGDDDDMIALSSSSPLALSCSPPRTPVRSRASSFNGPMYSRPGTATSERDIQSINGAAQQMVESTAKSSNGQSTPVGGNLLTVGHILAPAPSANMSSFRFPLNINPSASSPGPPGASTSVFSVKPSPATSPSPCSPTHGGMEHDELCPCDWSRFLPATLKEGFSPAMSASSSHQGQGQHYPPLTQADHDFALTEYFTYAASWQMRVVPRLFLRDMRVMLSVSSNSEFSEAENSSANLRVNHYSASLHCAVLAEAGAFAPPDSILALPAIRDVLARTARTYADAECTAPHVRALPSVLALTVLSQYHLGRYHGARLAFALFGMAVRLALSAGMNMDARAVLADEEEIWEREWCWCALFAQDVDMSLHVGQELTMLPPRDSTVPFTHPRDSLVGQTFTRTISLMRIAARMMALLGANGGGHNKPPISAISALQSELARWQADLPDPLQIHRASTSNALGHILVLHMAAQWVTILLHRPYYAGHGWTKDSRKFLDDACGKLLRAIGTYERLYGLRRAPLSLVQIVFVAGTAALVRADTLDVSLLKKRNEALELAKKASDALRELAHAYPCAAGYATALDARTDALREQLGRLQPLAPIAVVGHASLESPSHQRASSSLSAGSSSGLSYASTLEDSSSPGSSHSQSQSVPSVVVEDVNGPSGSATVAEAAMSSAMTGMELDAAASAGNPTGLFNMFGGPADFANYNWVGTGTEDPFATVTQNPYVAGQYGSVSLQLFGAPSANPGDLIGVSGTTTANSDSDMLGIESTTSSEQSIPFTNHQQSLAQDSSQHTNWTPGPWNQ
ncbi:hypothetical protein BKA62DRAFT_687959 [Auriculariales sp. MPI-PUGE-AT-0066]|nr:hypothetical protein BKA62DRAFT_687959 [Auriculariales sp. MPI-PUGE-AT-0066]